METSCRCCRRRRRRWWWWKMDGWKMTQMKTTVKKIKMMLLSVLMRASKSRCKPKWHTHMSLRVPAHKRRPLLATGWLSPTACKGLPWSRGCKICMILTERLTCLGDGGMCFHTRRFLRRGCWFHSSFRSCHVGEKWREAPVMFSLCMEGFSLCSGHCVNK